MAQLTEIKGLNDFSEKLKLAEKKAPGLIIDKYEKAAKDLKKKIKKATPYVPNSRYDGEEKTPSQHLRGRWKANKVRKDRGVYHTEVFSTAPHYHLVERGHAVVGKGRKATKNGQSYVHGNFFFKKEIDKLEPELSALPEKIIDEIFDDLFEGK